MAIVPPAPVLDAIDEATSGLVLPGLRRTTRAQWHVTLQFLGDAVDVEAIGDALTDVSVTTGTAATVRLGSGGAFPRPRRATVLWLGVREGREFLSGLARAVGARVSPLGYQPDRRAFHAHLTLARAKVPTDLRGPVAAVAAIDVGPAWTMSDLIVFESRLGREGAQYEARRIVPLAR